MTSKAPGALGADVASAKAPEPTAPAAPAPPPSAPASQPVAKARAFDERLVLDAGRARVPTAEADVNRMTIHGELQLRAVAQSDLPLEPTPSDPAASLGQKRYVYSWMRITPRLQMGEWLEAVAQIDVFRGLSVGDLTTNVGTADDALDEHQPVGVDPRWLYVEARSKLGIVRVGQQGSHFGMGLVANDGDHPTFFGDYKRPNLYERVLIATRPLGAKSPLLVAVAGDLVFRDEYAKLTDGDRAFQGVAMARWSDGPNELGVYGVYRTQTRSRDASSFQSYDESLHALVVDVAGKFAAPIPGTDAFAYGQGELAIVRGDTNLYRTAYETKNGEREQVRSYGGAALLGAVHERGAGDDRFGDLVGQLEWGWASADANPDDGVTRRFAFDRSHQVGLIMFQALGWKTARASVAAADPTLVARSAPGLSLLPSNGGVFGATYLNPVFVYRPTRRLDAKLGAVLAQTTGDLVDPYRYELYGKAANYDGGTARKHDLGLELDGGVEHRTPLDYGIVLQLGAQAGVLFPGHAFDDAGGAAMPTQWTAVGRLGLQY